MSHFVPIKVRDLELLIGLGSSYATLIKHKGKNKYLNSIKIIDDENCEVRITNIQCRRYKMKKDDTIEVDILKSRFHLLKIFRTFGASQKIRYGDWNLGHYGFMLNSETLIDSVRGRRNRCNVNAHALLFSTEFDEQRKLERESFKIDFINSPFENLTCGFELETQSTKGITRGNLQEIYNESVVISQMEAGPASLPKSVRRNLTLWGASSEWDVAAESSDVVWITWVIENAKTYETAIANGFIDGSALAQIERLLYDRIEGIDEEEYDNEMVKKVSKGWNLVPNIEVTMDDSVQGFELRTKGANTIDEFRESLTSAFTLDHDIDARCSFHIHIAISKLKLNFNRAQRQHIIQYLFRNIHRLPLTIQERWKDNNANYFFLPDNEEDKMNFINFHSRFGTIEFRCFGNVQSYEEGMICLDLAIESLIDFYKNESFVYVDDDKWGSKARAAMETGSQSELLKFVEAHEKHIEIARENQEILKRIEPELALLNSNHFNYVVGE